jgi:uncharacterized protein DUF6629
MCFSATGSFAFAAALAAAGAASLHQQKAPSQRLLAWIPILFAVQQAAEGAVWLTIHDPSQARLHLFAVFTFLAFALIVWPTWMPLALLAAETRPRRRIALAALSCVGVSVSLYAGWQLLRGQPAARIDGHSISYNYANVGSVRVLALYLPVYVVATVVPYFVSTASRARTMGAVLAVSLLATFLIRRETLTSVWCFFAALMSAVIVLSLRSTPRPNPAA